MNKKDYLRQIEINRTIHIKELEDKLLISYTKMSNYFNGTMKEEDLRDFHYEVEEYLTEHV